MLKNFNKKSLLKALVFLLGLLAVAILLYLVFAPVFPEIKYSLTKSKIDSSNLEEVEKETNRIIEELESKSEKTDAEPRKFPESDYSISQNRLIITKIGVNAPIIQTDNEDYGLDGGVWLMPNGVTPDRVGNTIITGHRFKYLPPNNVTFYLFHKLKVGDITSVIWNKKTYYFKIKEIKIVDKTDLSVYNPSDKPILTLFTCHPIYSSEQRLVVVAELIKGGE